MCPREEINNLEVESHKQVEYLMFFVSMRLKVLCFTEAETGTFKIKVI